MPKIKESLVGKKFGRLSCVSYSFYKKGFHYWKCQCICGKFKTVQHYSLLYGRTKSCGCWLRDFARTINFKHGLCRADTYLYNTWQHIKKRCYVKSDTQYKYYGARKISLHPSWISSYEKFHKYIYRYLGPRPSRFHSIDRISNSGNYVPGNLRWATASTQQFNKRRLEKKHSYQGVRQTRNGTWEARICINKKAIQIGTYMTELKAVEAYNAYAKAFHGNIPESNKLRGKK